MEVDHDIRQDFHIRTQSTGLPLELVHHICLLAAESDRHTAHTLAFVSKSICSLTAVARWRTIAITSVFQCLPFWREVEGIPDDFYEVLIALLGSIDPHFWTLSHHPNRSRGDTDRYIDKGLAKYTQNEVSPHVMKARRESCLSFPKSGHLHEHIRHLFIDPDVSVDSASILHAGVKLDDYEGMLNFAWPLYIPWPEGKSCPKSKEVEDGQAISKSRFEAAFTKLRGLSSTGGDWSLEHLSISSEVLAHLPGRAKIKVKELSVVWKDADEVQMTERMLSTFVGVEKIYILGLDPDSELSGLMLPRHLLQTIHSSKEWKSVSYVRYDTRKFSFKPAEIFASRLRPLLLEPTLAAWQVNGDVASSSDAISYQHVGPRHAAPQRGAGGSTLVRRQRLASLTPVQHIRNDQAAQWLIEEGVGKLDLLQFAWQPMDDGDVQAKLLPLHRRARYTVAEETDDDGRRVPHNRSDDTGGWPREMRGAWTERSDRDSQPSFEAELRDAIAALYGWQAPLSEPALKYAARQSALADKGGRSQHLGGECSRRNVAFSPEGSGEWIERVKSGFSGMESERLHDLRRRLALHLGSKGDPVELQYGVRAPQSLLHLGGKVPYRASERLALFEDRARGGKGVWP